MKNSYHSSVEVYDLNMFLKHGKWKICLIFCTWPWHTPITLSWFFFYQIVLIPCDFLTLNLREVWIKNYLDFLEIDRFYADDGDDIVLIYSKKKDQFFALGAVCSHEGSSFINPRLLWLVPPFLRFNVGPRGESRRNLG